MPNRAPVDWTVELAAQLRAAGYTAESLRSRLHVSNPDDIGLLNHAPAVERLATDRSPAATLIRLFFLETDETRRLATAALGGRLIEMLAAAGLLRLRATAVQARLRIDAVSDQYFIADRRFRSADFRALRLPGRDPVYPPSSDSLLLRDAVAAPTARHVLDLCTGSGIQALARAPQAERVVAVDLNPRAAAIARLNTHLSGVANVDVRVGDLYAPVGAEQFDLIIANPPFVSSPYVSGPTYHAGGRTGDRVLARIIDGWGTHLLPGGRAFAISHVALRAEEDMPSVAARWFRNFPGRALVVVPETGTPVDLAAAQALFALERGLAAYAAEVRRWVDYLRRHRIHTVALILIAAERGPHPSVEVIDAPVRVLPIPLSLPPTERIAAWLASSDERTNHS